MGSLHAITPSLHVHLLQGFPAGAKVSPFATSRLSNQQPAQDIRSRYRVLVALLIRHRLGIGGVVGIKVEALTKFFNW